MENRTITILAPDRENCSLREVMDEMASKAAERGLTAEILDSLLESA
jgi:hypothetical protein